MKPSVFDMPANEADVARAYEMILRRSPESEAACARMAGLPRHEVIKALIASEEYRRSTVAKLEEDYFFRSSESRIDTGGSPEDIARLMERIRAVWTRYGREDPHWSVLTNEAFRRDALDERAERAFFDSGAQDTQAFLNMCKRNGVTPRTKGAVLDFGCGLGRVGAHLAKTFSSYIGIDISAPHLRLAAERLPASAKLMLLPEFLDSDIKFDALYTALVLQHNPPPVIASLLRRLLGALSPGGVAFFQLPCALFDYRFDLREYLNAPSSGAMEMHAVPQHEIFAIVAQAGCKMLEVAPDGRAGNIGRSFTFLAAKP